MQLRLGSFFLVVTLGLAAAGVRAQDDETARARSEFSRGVERYGMGDFDGALEAFQEAYRLQPHPSVRVNMANCYERLGRPIEAIFHYERFLAEAQDAAPAQRRDVQRALDAILGQVGRVSLRVLPDGATVTIDGSETRRAPILEPMRLAAGRHTVEVVMEGYQPMRREVAVTGGQPLDVELRLERIGAPTAAATTTAQQGTGTPSETAYESASLSPADTGDSGLEESAEAIGQPGLGPEPGYEDDGGELRLNMPVLIAGGATAAFLVTATITGILALNAQSDFDQAVVDSNDPAVTFRDRYDATGRGLDAADRANNLALATDLLLVGALLGAGATTYFLFFWDDGTDESCAAGPSMLVTPVATTSGAGLVLSGEL